MKKLCFIINLTIITGSLFSQPGALDPSFGKEGKLLQTTPISASPVYSLIAKDDGKILGGIGDANNFIVEQYLNDGTPDSAFGINGNATTYFDNFGGVLLSSIAFTDDKKIVAAGWGLAFFGSHFSDVLLTKFLENGQPDISFGDNGRVVADFGLIEYISCMKITKEKKILVSGYCSVNLESQENFFLAQFNSDGTIDTQFGDGGKVITDVDENYQSYINSIAIAPDGSIIAAGRASPYSSFSNTQFVLAKYTKGGKLIADFGNNGLVFTNIGADADYANAVALQKDDKIVAAGLTNEGIFGPEGMSIVRYNATGTLDTSFNKKGSLTIFFGEDNAAANALIVQDNGNFILGGLKSPKVGSTEGFDAYDFALASVTTEGKIDSSFGINGLVTTDFYGFQDDCYSLALQTDGKIIAAGGSYDVKKNVGYITFARYFGNGTRRQIIISKIRRWLQHHNGIEWDNGGSGVKSYTVERSSDGAKWSAIATYTAASLPNAAIHHFEDPAPISNTSYYRVSTTDKDGLVERSNIIQIESEASMGMKLYPNPAQNSLHIEGLPGGQKTSLSVFDSGGKVKLQTVANGYSHTADISSLRSGVYLLRCEAGGNVVTGKFVKQ